MIWFICSGTGGVGKSSLAAALSISAAKKNLSVILLDASGLMHTCDAYLGVSGKAVLDLEDVLSGEASIASAVYETKYKKLSYVMTSHERQPHLAEYTDCLLALQSMCALLIVDLGNAELDIDPEIVCRDDRFILMLRPDLFSLRTAEQLLLIAKRFKAETALVLNFVSESDKHALRTVLDSVEVSLGYSPDSIIPWKAEKVLPVKIEDIYVNRTVMKAAEEMVLKWCAV